MPDISWQELAAKTVPVLQILVAAMVAGIFLVVAVFGLRAVQPGLPLPIPLALIVLLLVGLEIIARAFVLSSMARKARREIARGTFKPFNSRQQIGSPPPDPAGKPFDLERASTCLLPVFQQRTIVSAALFEGCAFLATIAYLVEGAPLSLGLAVLLVLVVAAHFPTQSRAIDWVERQIQMVEQDAAAR